MSAVEWLDSLSPWPREGFGVERMRALNRRVELDSVPIDRVATAALMELGLLAGSAGDARSAGSERVGAGAVGAELKGRERGFVGRFNQGRGRGITKNGPQAAIPFVNVLAVSLGRDEQHALDGSAAHQTIGQRQSVDESRAA